MKVVTILELIIVLTVISAIAALSSNIVASVGREVRQSKYYRVISLAAFFYALGMIIEFLCTGMEASYVGLRIQYLGIPFLPVLFLFATADFLNVRISSVLKNVLLIAAGVTFIIMQTNEYHHLYYKAVGMAEVEGINYLVLERYFGFYFNLVIGLGCIYGAEMILIRQGIKRGFRRGPSSLIIAVGAALPTIASLLFVTGIIPYMVDITPIALGACCLVIAASIAKHGVDDLIPLAEQLILNNLCEGMLVLDGGGCLLYCNEAAKRMLPKLELARQDRPLSETAGMPAFGEISPGSGIAFTNDSGEGICYYRMTCRSLVKGDAARGMLLTVTDVTEHNKLLEELRLMADTDYLTGLYNQRMFDMLANLEIDRAQRSGRPLSIVSFDLDGFKIINDTYGHPAGDLVLHEVTAALKRRVRVRDIYARLGGDEFSILLPETDGVDIQSIASDYHRIIGELDIFVPGIKGPLRVTCSFGAVTFYEFEDVGVRDMIRHADQALYLAKNNGRNRVWYLAWPPFGDLHNAVDKDAEYLETFKSTR